MEENKTQIDRASSEVNVDRLVRQKIYDKLLYYCWCQRFEKDEFLLSKTHEEFNEFLKDTKEHFGDCTLDPTPCCRCHLQACEVEAQKLYNYLFRDIKMQVNFSA